MFRMWRCFLPFSFIVAWKKQQQQQHQQQQNRILHLSHQLNSTTHFSPTSQQNPKSKVTCIAQEEICIITNCYHMRRQKLPPSSFILLRKINFLQKAHYHFCSRLLELICVNLSGWQSHFAAKISLKRGDLSWYNVKTTN